jgi:hypothetical protein
VTTNFVNVFRHFGPNAEKVLLGKLGLKFGKEYFFEYDENYVSSFPNPSPLLLRSRHTARTKLKISFLFS